MKKLTYLLSVLLVTGLFTVATAQTAPKAKASKFMGKMSHDYCMMKDGKMTMVKNGKPMPITHDMTMSDGSMCMTDGTCKMKDGTTMKMKDGQCMMNGKMTIHPGSTKRPIMKCGDKMEHMKM
ncbi:MAG: hypothetical protein JWR44_1293 [Hymenobacter sp.]|jgi:hypothetical protein|nr:hypothetical protein [Hymenobacter sp.]